MSTAIIVQARVGSTRFPDKMTIPFYGSEGMLHFLLTRLINANLSAPIILAIPDSRENDILETIGHNLSLQVFRGSENNVLQRFIAAAENHDANKIIRVCADNPFLDIHSLKYLIEERNESNADYIPFCLSDNTPTIKTHFGFWAEGVNLSTLKTIALHTKEKLYLEHVTNYIYSLVKPRHALAQRRAIDQGSAMAQQRAIDQPQPLSQPAATFTIHRLYIDPTIEGQSWARFTVDTETDFQTMKSLAAQLPPHPNVTPLELISLINSHPEIKKSMQAEIDKNRK